MEDKTCEISEMVARICPTHHDGLRGQQKVLLMVQVRESKVSS